MPGRRVPISRMAGIAAWTAASVTWGTTVVALANHEHTPSPQPDDRAAPGAVEVDEVGPRVPTMPASGLVVLRYTPTEPPEPEVIVRTVISPGAGSGADGSPAPRERSSGS